ncbi:hypothetical protein B0H14DRAFT_3526962 [Mycena olivaceomarginata]|nr:hypothetical protein B0H14DRAFT_3526962 [Mycena olivaceomarginata]
MTIAAGVEKKVPRADTGLEVRRARLSDHFRRDADDDQAMTDEGEMSPVGQPNAKAQAQAQAQDQDQAQDQASGEGEGEGEGEGGKPKHQSLTWSTGTARGERWSWERRRGRGRGRRPHPRALSAEVRASLEVIQEKFPDPPSTTSPKAVGSQARRCIAALGTTPKVGRAPSAWNVWQKWWADEEDAKNLPRGQFAKAARAALKVKCKIDDTFTEDMLNDSEAVFKRLPWLRKWHDTINAHALADIRSKGKLKGRLQREARALTQISKQLYNSYKVHCWGYVIDTQGDSSFVFGEGDDFKEMRQTQLHNLAQQMKDQEHMFGCV